MNRKELAHAWAQQTKQRASGSHFSFEGPKLYSYSTQIGERVSDALFILSDTKYSSSTSAQMSAARMAIPHIATTAYVAGPRRGDRWDIPQALKDRAAQLQKALRAMAYPNQDIAQHDMDALTAVCMAARALKIRAVWTREGWPELFRSQLPWGEHAQRWENATKTAREKARKQKERDKHAAQAELAQWRNGEKDHMAGAWRLPSEALRVKGDHLETTKGASVPLDAARVLWNAWSQGLSVVGRHVGPYQVNEATPERLTVGCHHIDRTEAQAIAKAQGW